MDESSPENSSRPSTSPETDASKMDNGIIGDQELNIEEIMAIDETLENKERLSGLKEIIEIERFLRKVPGNAGLITALLNAANKWKIQTISELKATASTSVKNTSSSTTMVNRTKRSPENIQQSSPRPSTFQEPDASKLDEGSPNSRPSTFQEPDASKMDEGAQGSQHQSILDVTNRTMQISLHTKVKETCKKK